jgi:hypothetical protein
MPSGASSAIRRGHYVVLKQVEAGRKHLRHQPAIIAIHDERRHRVALAVNYPPRRGVDAGAPPGGLMDLLPPPAGVDGPLAPFQQAQGDFGAGRTEGLAEEPAV